MHPPDSNHPDLRESLATLWRRKWVILACLVLVPAAVYFVSSRSPNVYETSVSLQVQALAVDTSLFTGNQPPPVGQTSQDLAAAARLVETPRVAREVARRLDVSVAEPRRLLDNIAVTSDEEAQFVTITVAESSPQRAVRMANAFASALVKVRATLATSRIDEAVRQLEPALERFPEGDPEGRRELAEQLQRLRALRAAQRDNAQVVESPILPKDPSAPKPIRNALVALVLGLALGIGLALLLERLNRRVRDSEELEELAGLPLLASVPSSAFPGKQSRFADAEAFHTLGANLTYFNVDSPRKSVLVTSALEGEGKTTVAVHLAVAMARVGKNVLLIDGDLRRPGVARHLGLDPQFGLEAVLASEKTLIEGLVEVATQGGRLRVLSAVPVTHPAELISSERMRLLVSGMSDLVDFVVIDTAPLLHVSDALPFMDQVSGVIMVARVGKTTRTAVTRALTIIRNTKAEVVGVVATGVKAAGLYGYGAYGYGQPQSMNGGPREGPASSRWLRWLPGRRRGREESESPDPGTPERQA